MDDLKKTFEKEPLGKRVILISALAALVSSFLPWWSDPIISSLGAFSFNGWHSFGYLNALGSLAIILLWLLPKVGVKFTLPAKEAMLYKILIVVMSAGPVMVIIDSKFEFSFLGTGLYISLIACAVAVYFGLVKPQLKKSGSKKEAKKEEKK